MTFKGTTAFESEIIAMLIEAGEFDGSAALHRINITTSVAGVTVAEETNDNNDDGYADGEWVSWKANFRSLKLALEYAGKCRVGVSGIIVTVTRDGEEVR